MAKYSHRIQADRRTVTSRGMYIYGNTVRQAEVMPQRQEEPRKEHKKKKLDRQILKNRRKAMRMNPAYVMFLSIAAAHGADPLPASFENRPRLIPFISTAPNPPAAT